MLEKSMRWLWANRKWLFSGIGIFAISSIGLILSLNITKIWLWIRTTSETIAPHIAIWSSVLSVWLTFPFLIWLCGLTWYILRKNKESQEREFKEDFRHGLDHWEYQGNWRTEREDGQRILVVTNSTIGGIARPCRLWSDYEFRFETKIVHSNSTWIVRASDTLNYLMLQCGRTEINPLYWVNGLWFSLDSEKLEVTLPKTEWFPVMIKVSGERVVVNVTLNGKSISLLDSLLLK